MGYSRSICVRDVVVFLSFMTATLLVSCSKQDTINSTNGPGGTQPIISPIPKTPPAITYPADNTPLDLAAEVDLGRHLFYDKQLSVDGSTSCASCHQVQNGFADVLPVSIGFQKQLGKRNAPGLTNVAYNSSFTWDGKFPSLEKHAPGPMFNSLEMGNNFINGIDSTRVGDTVGNGYNSKPGNNDTLFLFGRLDGNPKMRSAIVDQNSPRKDLQNNNYYTLLKKAWGPVTIQATTNGGRATTTMSAVAFTMDIIAKSIAAFERTFISNSSPFDRYNSGDLTAMNANAIRGYQLFIDPGKANCISCHSGYNFTDQQYHNNGSVIPMSTDIGRAGITKQDTDKYKFKTPTLRNVSLTKPYLHDGRIDGQNATAALFSLLSNYNTGGLHSQNQDPRIKPLSLSDQDLSDIVEFLKELQDGNFTNATSLSNPWAN